MQPIQVKVLPKLVLYGKYGTQRMVTCSIFSVPSFPYSTCSNTLTYTYCWVATLTIHITFWAVQIVKTALAKAPDSKIWDCSKSTCIVMYYTRWYITCNAYLDRVANYTYTANHMVIRFCAQVILSYCWCTHQQWYGTPDMHFLLHHALCLLLNT